MPTFPSFSLNPVPLPATLPALSGGNIPFNLPSLGVGTVAASLLNQLSGGLGSIINTFTAPPQYFYGISFPNNQSALYQIRIYANTTVWGQGLTLPDLTYTFPLTPSSISYQNSNMVTFYDIHGPASMNGVQRIIDQYGQNLPIITMSGTTGYQFHSADNFQYSGRLSLNRLQDLITAFHQLTQAAIQSNNSSNLPVMTFGDGFTGETWQVVPLGPIVINQDANRPIIQYYSLTFVVQQNLADPEVEGMDPLSLALLQFEGNLEVATRDLLSEAGTLLQDLILGPAGLVAGTTP